MASWLKRFAIAMAFVLTAATIAACGGDSSSDAGTTAAGGEDSKEEPTSLSMAAFPGFGPTAALAATATSKGIDEKHGIKLDVQYMGTIGAYYTSLANGSVDSLAAGLFPTAAQILDGVPIQVVNTLQTFALTGILTKDPDINSLADLKGKTLGATTAGSEFQSMTIVAESDGIDVNKDVKVQNAEIGGMLALIAADRVDAVQPWEPTKTQMLTENPDLREIWNGEEGWEEMTGRTGRNLNFVVREDVLNDNPGLAEKIAAMWAEVVDEIEADPDGIDELLEDSNGMFANAQKNGSMGWKVDPAWDEDALSDIDVMLDYASKAGFIKSVPDNIVYQP